MSDFYQKSLSSPHATNAFLQPTQVDGMYNTTMKDNSGITHRMNAKHAVVKIESDITARQAPISSVPSNVYDGGQLEFRLEKGSVDLLDHCYLRYDLNNASGASITVNNSFLSLNYVQVFGQNSADLLYQESGVSMWLNAGMSFSRNEFEIMAAKFGSNTTYAVGSSIGIGATKSFYLPLTRLFHQARLCLAGLQSELVIRFVFNNASQNVSTGGTTPLCNQAYLLLRGSYEPVQVSDQRIKLYKSPAVLTIPYIHPLQMNQTMALTANSNFSIVLSGLKGLTAMLTITVRQSPLPNLANGNFLSGVISTFDIQNPSGESMLGHYQLDFEESKKLIYAEKYDNLYGENSNFIVVPFCKNPSVVLKEATNNGYQPFTGFEKLNFTTQSGLASGSYTVDIIAYVYSTAHIQAGSIRTRKP